MKELGTFNRIEVIDHSLPLEDGGGRAWTKWVNHEHTVQYDVQDDGRTLKIFIGPEKV